mmetsp:Transcript_1476/g.3360  ORF Transcript_1476/g.3360 Transcript_1476/m.3360 type:complete len:244 (+) Transcript_1476:621-1352(+)
MRLALLKREASALALARSSARLRARARALARAARREEEPALARASALRARSLAAFLRASAWALARARARDSAWALALARWRALAFSMVESLLWRALSFLMSLETRLCSRVALARASFHLVISLARDLVRASAALSFLEFFHLRDLSRSRDFSSSFTRRRAFLSFSSSVRSRFLAFLALRRAAASLARNSLRARARARAAALAARALARARAAARASMFFLWSQTRSLWSRSRPLGQVFLHLLA